MFANILRSAVDAMAKAPANERNVIRCHWVGDQDAERIADGQLCVRSVADGVAPSGLTIVRPSQHVLIQVVLGDVATTLPLPPDADEVEVVAPATANTQVGDAMKLRFYTQQRRVLVHKDATRPKPVWLKTAQELVTVVDKNEREADVPKRPRTDDEQ